jgi:5-hydroxyisourate hydrolase/2-oxo-4-hydroxy-4-carboxy-5-ureidoimidazoline decarboxylase
MIAASKDIIRELAKANIDYEKKFGFIFIISAAGKSASAMLQLLNDRMDNSIHEELRIAMGEQHKITQLRLRKLLESSENGKSRLTTHVLDTSTGRPARNIIIRLKDFGENKWETFAQGLTDDDGRINDLVALPILKPGNYKLLFNTGSYFQLQNIKTFYPEVEIQFSIDDDKHYHVPLLINPFGYSTYRGS